jgi:hypothetical protein
MPSFALFDVITLGVAVAVPGTVGAVDDEYFGPDDPHAARPSTATSAATGREREQQLRNE